MFRYYSLLAILAGCLTVTRTGLAQTIVVDAANGSPNNVTTFNNLQDAIGSFRTSASTGGAGVNNGNAAPNIVNIVSTTPVTGTANFDALATSGNPDYVVMDENITVQGQGGNRAVYAGSRIPASTTNAFFVWRQKYNLTLNDLAIIPANTGASVLAYFKATQEAGDSPVITLNRCILTGNNGSNQPLTTTGLDDPSTTSPGVIVLPDGGDAIYAVSRVENGNITINLNDTIIASYATAGSADGIIMFMQGTTTDIINCFVNINAGCVVANTPRFAVQNPYGGQLVVDGTSVKPVIFRNIGSDAIWNFSDSSGATQPTAASINYANFYQINGSAIKEQETENRGFVKEVRNTKIAKTNGPAILLAAAGALPPGGFVTNTVTIDNVTIYNNTAATFPTGYDDFLSLISSLTYTDGNGVHTSNRNVNVTNSTLTGGVSQNGIYNSSNGVYNVSSSITSLTGANALGTSYNAVSPGVINQGSGNSTGAVTFANTTDPANANFLVATSAIADWSVY